MLDRITPNPREVIGGNQPPGPLAIANDTMTAISDWMKAHPVVTNEGDARAAKLQIDRGNASLDEMERERDGMVRPLNEQVTEINGRYRPVRTGLEKLRDEIKKRLTTYVRTLEQERLRAAEEAARVAAETERLAREAEAREREAVENAAHGECDLDFAGITQEADTAFAAFEKANRTAARAERDTKVRVTGGFGNAISLREKETLAVTDWQAAIAELGLTDTIRDAILSSVRAYRKIFHELPEGIEATYERSL
jgi:chorismate mutase